MYRAGILKKDGEREAQNFATKDEAELWVLQKAEAGNLVKSIIVNKENIQERHLVNWEKENGR
jgi:hypothetical protein